MRLLQLRTPGPSLIDLHPNLTVVQGLDAAARDQLAEAVRGLATGVATSEGLLEAHGVLFDLTTELLALLDVASSDRSPVVTAADLPSPPGGLQGDERAAARRALADATERCRASAEGHDRAMAEVDAARSRLAELQAELEAAEAGVTGRLASVDERAAALDQAQERRRRLAEELADLVPQVTRATDERAAIEESTVAVRAARDDALERAAALDERLEAARAALTDFGTEDQVAAAAAELSRVEAEVAAEEEAEQAARAALADGPSPADELEVVVARLDEIDQRLAGIGAVPAEAVQAEIQRVRALPDVELVASPEAQELADQIEALPTPDHQPAPEEADLAGARARLDDARQALLVAEQDLRNPPLDPALVQRLEATHADLLEALDRVDGRFGGNRARRQAEQLRAAEQEVLDQLGFGSYSDYMIGSSVRPVDREKSATLDAARAELAAAEDAWRGLQELTDAELARAEALDRRRILVEQAQQLLGRAVSARTVVDELRALRVEAAPTGDPAAPLRAALDHVGLDLGAADLDRQDLLLVAEAWVEEAGIDQGRLQDLAEERGALQDKRASLLARLEEAAQLGVGGDGSRREARAERVATARQALAEAEQGADAHRRAVAELEKLSQEHAEATAAAEAAESAASEADASVAAAQRAVDELAIRLAEVETALASAMEAEAESERLLSTHHGVLGPEELEALRTRVAELTDALELRQAAATAAEEVHARHRDEQEAAERALDAVAGVAGSESEAESAEPSVADEIEWNLLARLASQRSVSLAGSTPLLLDDALLGVPEPELGRILGRLERMADAVQVILVTDSDAAASWANLAGSERAAVVTPQPT